MIEKKISYDINIEKPSKTKPVKQGGVLNYLGKQKTVNAPRHWRSSPKHPIAHLSYITKDEEKILVDLNLYGSLKGKPNKGPFGLPSLQGSGGGSEGAGTGDGPGTGAAEGTAQGSGPNEAGVAGEAAANAAADAAAAAAATAEGGFGIGPGDDGPGLGVSDTFGSDTATSLGQTDTFGSDVDESAVDMSTPALQSLQDKAMVQARNTFSPAGIFGGLLGMMTGLPAGFTIGSQIASSMARGVVTPGYESRDEGFVDNVQSMTPTTTESGGGGITTIPTFAPLVNVSTGDPLLDSLIARYRMDPVAFGIR